MAESIKLSSPSWPLVGEVNLPISKSIANRLLVLTALTGNSIKLDLENLSDDVCLMQTALTSNTEEINVDNAGTAMRFLTAFFAAQQGRDVVLSGNTAMKQRPIGQLVQVLKELGSDIEFVEIDGFPPLRIKGKKLKGGSVELVANISSQFVSALMLLAPFLDDGLTIKLNGDLVSSSYISLTQELLETAGVKVEVENRCVSIAQNSNLKPQFDIETDWSAASYFYAMVALRPGSRLLLKGLKLESVQGDKRVAEILKDFGVESIQTELGVEVSCHEPKPIGSFSYDLSSEPDIAQTLVCFHAARGDKASYSGIDHLRLKETDRLTALQTELKKFDVSFERASSGWKQCGKANWNGVPVSTYGDHRMAMAFSILSLCCKGLEIEEPKVVSKSFPNYWESISQITITSEP